MIKGSILRDAVISGANAIVNEKSAVDELNIFPVPDGDTGTNMSMTMSAASKALAVIDKEKTASEIAAAAASAMLRGARGNSGVILSLLFRGFSQGLKDVEEANASNIAEALRLGVDNAYKAVMKPTEGTMLTVARLAAEKAEEFCKNDNDPVRLWDAVCDAAEAALDTTPELLPVLKRAGVVDAGGKGICVIFRGMQSVFEGNGMVGLNAGGSDMQESQDNEFKSIVAQFDSVINFTYCTEFIVEKENDKDPAELRAFLESIGDCVVVVDDDEIVKVHVHSNAPGDAITHGLEYGSMITVKVENMKKQHEAAGAVAEEKGFEYAEPVDELGFVAVAAGDGLRDLFKELGCANVVSGGQTMNPSTDDILEAVQATPAKTVIVLPNNKNIVMAAQQVIPIADREVIVLPTKTIPQGISAMLAADMSWTVSENTQAMEEAYTAVDTGSITYAARDSGFDNKNIKEGDILCLKNGKLTFTEKDPVKAVVRLGKSMITRNTSFVTLIFGEGVTEEEAESAREQLQSKVGKDIEVTVIDGGQPVYYFYISVE